MPSHMLMFLCISTPSIVSNSSGSSRAGLNTLTTGTCGMFTTGTLFKCIGLLTAMQTRRSGCATLTATGGQESMNHRRKIKDHPPLRLLSPPRRTAGRVQGPGAVQASGLGVCGQVIRSIPISLPFLVLGPKSPVTCDSLPVRPEGLMV